MVMAEVGRFDRGPDTFWAWFVVRVEQPQQTLPLDRCVEVVSAGFVVVAGWSFPGDPLSCALSSSAIAASLPLQGERGQNTQVAKTPASFENASKAIVYMSLSLIV